MKKTKNNNLAIIIGIAVLIILPLVVLFVFTNPFQQNKQENELEILRYHADRPVYFTLSELLAASDIVVIGEFSIDTVDVTTFRYSGYFEKEILDIVQSYNYITVIDVLSGDIINEPLKIIQGYGYEHENKLVTHSEMLPMNKGDQWIFFLKRAEDSDLYYCVGDSEGRYPVPTARISDFDDYVNGLSAEDFGVYEDVYVKIELYREIVERFFN
ncbi:MAG: hypothetical protein FWD34_04385 [Oscillospiraceae bacterium]|nr:hypothetical protein [Oscillospiraceae bacterium]